MSETLMSLLSWVSSMNPQDRMVPAQVQPLRSLLQLKWTSRLGEIDRRHPLTTRRKLPTALLWQHRRQEDAGPHLKQDLLAPLWNAPNPRVEAGPWRGRNNSEDDEERSPSPIRMDAEDPTDAISVDLSNPELPLGEEASVPSNQKKKSGKDRISSDVQVRNGSRTSPDSSRWKPGREGRTNPTTSRSPSSLPMGVP